MTSSIIYSRLNVKMKSGDTAFSEDISLERGTCIGVVFIPFKKEEPEFAVDIEIRLPQGGVLLNPTDYRDYTHKGGGFFNGMKQVNFPTNNNRFFISVNSENQLVNDFNGQLIFAIKREEKEEQ